MHIWVFLVHSYNIRVTHYFSFVNQSYSRAITQMLFFSDPDAEAKYLAKMRLPMQKFSLHYLVLLHCVILGVEIRPPTAIVRPHSY